MECFFPSYSKYFEALPFSHSFRAGWGQGNVGGTSRGAPFMAEGVL